MTILPDSHKLNLTKIHDLGNALIAQLVEHGTENPCVRGSSPRRGTTFKNPCFHKGFFYTLSQTLELRNLLMSNFNTNQFHRFQFSKAMNFIRNNTGNKISLDEISKESGSSKYHFTRVFMSYAGETPFKTIQRLRIEHSLKIIEEEQLSMTEISQIAGFETPSAFNKVFKKWTNLSPSDFRNIGKEEKESIRYSLALSPKTKELKMRLNLTKEPEIVDRNETLVWTLKTEGEHFSEIAPAIWMDFLKFLGPHFPELAESEFMGISSILHGVESESKSIYKAAVSVSPQSGLKIEGLEKEMLPKRRYAKFLLKGPHVGVWPAFEESLNVVNESELELGEGECLEVYLNDPSQIPEEDLLTEILIPIK